MFERDENGLNAAKKDRANFVCAKLSSGKIVGYFSYIRNARWIGGNLEGTETFSIDEYEWLTDKTRDRKVTTAADLYDKVSWTKSGFKVGGEKIPIVQRNAQAAKDAL